MVEVFCIDVFLKRLRAFLCLVHPEKLRQGSSVSAVCSSVLSELGFGFDICNSKLRVKNVYSDCYRGLKARAIYIKINHRDFPFFFFFFAFACFSF